MLRLSPPDRGRLRAADELAAHVAGSEANVAAALASLGVEVAWISALPDSPLGSRVAATLAQAGVDLRFVEWEPDGRLGLFFVEFGAAPRPTAVWYDRVDSSFARMCAYDRSALEGARFAVVSGITPGISERASALTDAFVADARDRGAELCVDVNYRRRIWAPPAARRRLAPLLELADVVVCSRRDAADVFGVEAELDADAALALREQFAPEARAVVLTLGARGCVAVEGSSVFVQTASQATVVDRIGAGDAFVAGLLWGLLADEGLANSLPLATALGALACTVHGDQALFTPAEVRAVAADPVALIR